MATVSSYDIVKKIVDNNGHYSDDPVPIAILEYTDMSGNIVWSICYVDIDLISAMGSAYVHNPKPIWTRRDGKLADPTPPQKGS